MKKFFALLALCAVGLVSVRAQERQGQDDTAKPTEGFTLKTAETIEFTTDEVTWMQVDVSPDGRTILFDLLGDLYTMPIGGGEATRIMGGLSFESQPTWSPDGKTIAFLTDRTGVENLWIADADGSNPRAVSKDAPHQRSAADHGVAGLDARRQLHRGVEVAPARSGDVLAIHVSPRRRHRRPRWRAATAAARSRRARPAARAADEQDGRGRVARRPLHLLHATHRHLHLQRAFPALADLPSRPRDRRRHADHQRARQRAFARRFRRTANGWSSARVTKRTPGCASATSRPAPSDGSPIRSRETIRSRAPAATRCRAMTSCLTASR